MASVIVAAVPFDEPGWAFHVINDDDVPIDSIVVESVHYTPPRQQLERIAILGKDGMVAEIGSWQ